MVAHRLGNPGPGSVSATPEAGVPAPRRRSPWVGHLSVCGLGVLGVFYLMLVWRAHSLDHQVVLVEERLAAVEFEHLRAKRQLADLLPQAAPIGEFTSAPKASSSPPSSDPIRCPALPPIQPSALSALAGSTTPGGAPASQKPPVAPPQGKVARRTDLP